MEITDVFYTLGIVFFVALTLTHILPVFINRKTFFGYLGISLYAAFLVSSFVGGAELSFILLLSMASVALHSGVSYFMSVKEKRNDV